MLEIRNVSKVYRSKTGEEVKALDNVSISFPESGMVFILGKSGSGKSTLLNVMGGLDSYDSGEFIIKGKSSEDFVGSDFDAYRNTFIGFIFQEYNILEDFTVGANIGLALELQGKKATDEAVNGILEQVDLLTYAKRKPNELSGGQKQRVAIARALVKEPEIIMADEPTGALDSNTGKQIFDTLKSLSKEKLVLVVSHDRDFAERYADRIIEMADGHIIEDVTKHERQAVRISDGVHQVNDHILRIEKGYKLTAADLEMINAYLAKNNGDVLLSGDGRVNEELRSAAGITKDGASTVFEGTDPQKDIKAKTYDKANTKFIRSRLPMKNAVKMGASGLKHKKFRLFMTILLSFVAFAMFGLANSMAAYEKIHAATQSIIDSEIRSAAVTLGVRRTTIWDDGDSYTHHEGQGLNEEDIKWLEQQTGLKFIPVFTGYSTNQYNSDAGFPIDHMMDNYSRNELYTANLAGFTSVAKEQLPDYQLTAGRWVEKDGEVVITEFIYRQFKQYGYSDGTTTVKAADVTADSIIGKTITIDRIGWNTLSGSSAYEFEIVGIVDTRFNYDRYQKMMPVDSQQQQQQQQSGVQEEAGLLDMFLQQEVDYERDYGWHALAFATQSDIDSMTAWMSVNGGGGGGGDFVQYMHGFNGSAYFVGYKPAEGVNDPKRLFGVNSVIKSEDISKLGNILWFDSNKTALGENELLLSINYLENIFNENVDITMDFTAFDSAMTAKFGTAYTSGSRSTYAIENAAIRAYIRQQLADPAILAQVNEDKYNSGNDHYSAEEYWGNQWDGWNLAYVPDVPGKTISTRDVVVADVWKDTQVQNAIGALVGFALPADMSAKGYRNLLNIFGQPQVQFNSILTTISQMYVQNYIIANDLTADNAYEGNSWIKQALEMYGWENQDWLDQSEESRYNILMDRYGYSAREDAARYGTTSTALWGNALAVYLKMTGQTAEDLITMLDGLTYQMEESVPSDKGENFEPIGEAMNVKIVGFYAMDGDMGNHAVVGDVVYNAWKEWYDDNSKDSIMEGNMPQYTEERAEHEQGIYAFAVAAVSSSDEAAIQKLVELTYADPESTDLLFELQNAVMYTLGSFNEIIEVLSQVFLWVGLGLAVFSSFLLMNFIATSISYKKREIGILRAVGARSSDVFKIFFSEAFIIAIINFILAVAASLTTVIILNNYMRSSGINITLLTFGPLQILLMLGISILVAALASFLPVRSIARKKPVDAIKDR